MLGRVRRDANLRNFFAPGATHQFGGTIREVHSNLARLINAFDGIEVGQVDEALQRRITGAQDDLLELELRMENLGVLADVDDIDLLNNAVKTATKHLRKLEAQAAFTGDQPVPALIRALRTVLIPGFDIIDQAMNADQAKDLFSHIHRECSYSESGMLGNFDVDALVETGYRLTTPVVDTDNNEGDKRILNNYGALMREAIQLFTVGGKTDLISMERFLIDGASPTSYLYFEIESMNLLSSVDLNPIATWGLFKREFSGTASRIYQHWSQTGTPVSGATLIQILLDTTPEPSGTAPDYSAFTVEPPVLSTEPGRNRNSDSQIESVVGMIRKLKMMKRNDDGLNRLIQAVADLELKEDAVMPAVAGPG